MSGTLRLSCIATNRTPINKPQSDAEAVLGMAALWPNGEWDTVRIKPTMMRYIQSEATRRGVSEAKVYTEIRALEDRVSKIMPSMDRIAAMPDGQCDEWLDDTSWTDVDT